MTRLNKESLKYGQAKKPVNLKENTSYTGHTGYKKKTLLTKSEEVKEDQGFLKSEGILRHLMSVVSIKLFCTNNRQVPRVPS